MRSPLVERSLVAVSWLVACGPASSTPGASSTTGGATPTTSGVTTVASSSSGDASSGSRTDSGSTSTGEAADETGPPPPPGFLNFPDVADGDTCSIYAENCPPGEKCMPFANDGGNSWNALTCRPVVDDPDAPGESCSVTMGSATDGYDTCEKHAMCWDVDPDTNEGTCVAMCVGGEATPTCLQAGTYCSIGGEAAIALCLLTCDPLVQNCGEGQGCYPGGAFCPEGAQRCCLPFCDVAKPDCPEPLECGAVFEPGSAQAGLEDVGVCGSG